MGMEVGVEVESDAAGVAFLGEMEDGVRVGDG